MSTVKGAKLALDREHGGRKRRYKSPKKRHGKGVYTKSGVTFQLPLKEAMKLRENQYKRGIRV